MNIPTEIGDVNAILAETPEKFQRVLPKEKYSPRAEPH